jgi:hypothetical protein
MAKVNIPGSGHGNMTSPAGNHYWEYTNKKAKEMLDQAIFIIAHNIKGSKS